MGEATVKYFDYMPRCGEALQARLGRADLATKIPLWRKHGTEDPDAVVTGCRNIAENALRILVDDKDADMRLVDLIGYAEDEGLIDKPMACKFQEIRRLGNNGAHRSVKVIDAQMALELIDDVLRYRRRYASLCAAGRRRHIRRAYGGRDIPIVPSGKDCCPH